MLPMYDFSSYITKISKKPTVALCVLLLLKFNFVHVYLDLLNEHVIDAIISFN